MNKYYIKYWESENDRNEVFSNYFFKTFDSFDEALKESRILFNKNNLSSLEIVDYTDKLYFSKDNISEDFYINGTKICKVSKDVIKNYINSFTNNQKLPFSDKLLYAEDQEIFIAIDNTSNNCWVEEFKTEAETRNWLLNKDNNFEMELEL